MKGQTIVEVVIALGAGIVVLTALTLMMLSSLNNASEGSSRTLATQYAQDGLELIRNIKDNNWSQLVLLSNNANNSYCMASSCSSLTLTSGSCGPKITTCGINVGNTFSRQVDVKPNDSRCIPQNPIPGKSFIRAVVTVSYGDGKCTNVSNPYCHNVQVESCFTNYDTRLSP